MTKLTKEQLIDWADSLIEETHTDISISRTDAHAESYRAQLALLEIALAALAAEPEEYIFDHPHGKLFRSISDKSNAGMPGVFPVYRLPLLEGLK